MRLPLLSSAAALVLSAAPAFAQTASPAHDMASMPGMDMSKMPGMTMPMPAAKTPAPTPDMANMPGMDMPEPAAKPPRPPHDMPQSPDMQPSAPQPSAHAAHDTLAAESPPRMAGMVMPAETMDMAKMASALGPYPMTRDASGTSWQPDASRHDGLHVSAGGWSLMGHAQFDVVYDSQSGARGGTKTFGAGMAMVQASHSLGSDNAIQFTGMFSPDPFMGPSGYPLLLATGETADGNSHLIDRQHPHDLFMELSGTLIHKIGSRDSVYLYAGLPGEPAFGPPAFMHRMSAMDSPEAPITHHWLDSTHITFGVVTGGWVHDNIKLEVSSFKGREPDQRRYDIEAPRLDSEAVRISWNPTANWSLQTSWAHLNSPEQLEPGNNEDRWSASAIYTRPVGKAGWWSSTAAFGTKRLSQDGRRLNAWLLESALKPSDPWTVYARAESVDNAELLTLPGGKTPTLTVSKLSLGAIHDWRAARHVKVGLGALYAFDFVPGPLEAAYGGGPHGAMVFMRLKID
jgi:hypothetical protein